MSTTEDTTAATAVKAEATTVAASEVAAPKMEETAAAAASTATPVVATEALAAAAAAAVNAVEVPPPDTVAAAAPGRVSLLNDVDGQGKRRFFPRVKHLIGNKEWEDFLTQVLRCIEEAGAPETAAASHKANNAWYKAFDLIYGGVAREYSIPTGKNRYHKFKDKILEVWVALESQPPGENHCRELAMEQYERYKRACADASKNGSAGHPSMPAKASKMAAGQTAHASYNKLAGGKRSYSTAMGGGASVPIGSAGVLWKNLDESKVLDKLPAALAQLVHLKQLSKEMAAGTGNRAARKGIEEHSKKLDAAYLEALTDYLKDGSSGVAEAKEEAAADGENGQAVKAEESADVEMADGEGTPATKEATAEPKEEMDPSEAYDKCLTVAFLYRYASTLHEQKVLAEAYANYTASCVTFAMEAAPAAATATTEAPPVTEAATAEAPVTDEATAAAAAAVAMEDGFPPVHV